MGNKIEGNGIIFKQVGDLERYQYSIDIDKIAKREILLKMEYSTICGSDLHTYLGHRTFNKPIMIGHEGIGRIISLGEEVKTDSFGNKVKEGDLILFLPYIWCNHCEYCARSQFTLCLNRTSVGSFPFKEGDLPRGTFSEHLVLPEGVQFIKIEDHGFPTYALSPVNCALSTVIRAFEDYTDNVFGKNVLILGAGALGIYATAIADSMGAKEIYVIDKNINRLNISKKYGATHTFASVDEMANSISLKNTDGIVDVTLDLIGYSPLVPKAIKLLRRAGKFIEIGSIFSNEVNGLDLSDFVVRGVNVMGFRTYEIRHLKDAYDFMVSKWDSYDFSSLVNVKHSLAEVKNAFEDALKGESVREGIKDVF